MATYTGGLVDGAVDPQSPGLGQHFDVVRGRWAIDEVLVGAVVGGSKTDTQPVNEFSRTVTGGVARGYERDFYNRIHVSPVTIDLANVISQQTRTVLVWNAYFVDRTLNTVSETGTEGMTFTAPSTPPINFRPLQERTFTITVGLDGPPVIAASYAFQFDTGTVTVSLTGSRVIAWLFPPNGEVLERLEWMTNVITSYNGREQRVRVRKSPRRYFEWDMMLTDRDRQAGENLLFGWQARTLAVPVWMDATTLASGVSAGASVVPVSTATRDYHAGGLAVLMTGPYAFEIVTINTVAANQLNLVRPLENAWAAGATIAPVRMARLPDRVPLRRFTGSASYGRLRFQCTDISTYTAATEATTHRGYPVLTLKPNWVEDVSFDYQRKLQWIDAQVGKITVDDEAGVPIFIQSHRWLLNGRTEIDAFRQWLYARQGRLTAFWLPSWSNDLTLAATIGSTAVNIDVVHSNYVKQVNTAIGRRDLRIELVDGTIFYRHIMSATEVSSTVERIEVDTSFGRTITAADIRLISFMALGRLDADAAEISWWKYDTAESALNVRTATNDI